MKKLCGQTALNERKEIDIAATYHVTAISFLSLKLSVHIEPDTHENWALSI